MPENIGPVRWLNKIVGTCLLVLATASALPVGAVLHYDGFAKIFDMPAMFNWFAAFAAMFLGSGIYLLATPQRVGGSVNFRKDGFSIDIRHFILKDRSHDVDWSNVQQVELLKAPRNQDGLTITLTHGAPVSFRTHYFEFGVDEILARLSASAGTANYRLQRDSGFNALVVEKQTWKVLPVS